MEHEEMALQILLAVVQRMNPDMLFADARDPSLGRLTIEKIWPRIMTTLSGKPLGWK